MFDIGDAIKKVREDRGQSQKELAARVKMRPNTWGDFEDDPHKCQVETLERISRALEISIPDLYRKLDEFRGIDQFKPASDASYEWREANLVYHRMLEIILNGQQKKWADGITANLEAMVEKADPSAGAIPKGKHGPFPPTPPIPGDDIKRKPRPGKTEES